MNKILFLLLAICSLQISAQTIVEDEWQTIGRPEHVYEYSENGIRRMPARIGSRQGAALRCTGSPKVPVILVEFPDRKFHASGTTEAEIKQSYNLFFNGKDNAEVKAKTGSRGSIQQYFRDQSLGAFEPEFELIGPIMLDESYAYYGANSATSKDNKDINIRELYREALQKSVTQMSVDWSNFDNDHNGTVDMVFFIHAGWGENTVGEEASIWAKESTSSMKVDGNEGLSVTFSCYAVCAEARTISKSKYLADLEDEQFVNGYNEENLTMDGIGVCIHELSHALGLPDFYDTRNIAFGMDLWSIMDYGEYGQNGFCPGGYNAYERDFMGWQELEVLTDTTILDIACFADGGHGYKIINEANEDEYYVIENRQPKGWDEMVCKKGRGLQVTHVDYVPSRWNMNSVNTQENHQHMTIIAANNNYNGTNKAQTSEEWNTCLAGNLFPYVEPSQSLTNTSVPAAVVYAGQTMNKPLYDITANEDGTITVYYLKTKEDFQKDFETAIRAQRGDLLVDIYDMRGIHILRCMPNELHRVTLNRGIYLVKFGDGTVRKVVFSLHD